MVEHQDRARVRAEAEERAVPERHLPVEAGEDVEARCRDPDVDRLGEQVDGRCLGRIVDQPVDRSTASPMNRNTKMSAMTAPTAAASDVRMRRAVDGPVGAG